MHICKELLYKDLLSRSLVSILTYSFEKGLSFQSSPKYLQRTHSPFTLQTTNSSS